MDFLNQEPTKQKGGPKRGWRCPETDLPATGTRCEIMLRTGKVSRAYFDDDKFYIAVQGNTLIAYGNPEGWRSLP